MVDKRRIAVAAAAAGLIAICVLRVAAVAAHWGPTNDETAHIAGGYDVLRGLRSYDIEHPPLARVLFALPLRSAPVPQEANMFRRGNALLANGDYLANLVRARRGNLVFLVAMLVAVFFWTRRAFGDWAALLALALISTLPPVLAHASLATTDLAVAALLPIACLATILWVERPTWLRTVLLGAAIGAGLLVKFSFLPFFAVALFFLLPPGMTRRHLRPAAVALGLAAVIVWGGYRFDFGTLAAAHPRGREMAHLGADDWMADVPVPAPLFFGGLLDVKLHNDRGHHSYLFGRWSSEGRWYYFPAVLLFKTPLPFLILAFVGAGMLIRTRHWALAVLPIAVLLPAMISSMNLGVRHVLPIYPLLALPAGYAAVSIRKPLLVGALLLWQIGTTTLAHPNYLGWFNELAGSHPERIALDSNLDWGQDALPLARAARALNIQRIGLAIISGADLDRIGMPPHYALDPREPAHGWVAVSAETLIDNRRQNPASFPSLSGARRSIRVGSSITLYELP